MFMGGLQKRETNVVTKKLDRVAGEQISGRVTETSFRNTKSAIFQKDFRWKMCNDRLGTNIIQITVDPEAGRST
jgi:hypothetical protein